MHKMVEGVLRRSKEERPRQEEKVGKVKRKWGEFGRRGSGLV